VACLFHLRAPNLLDSDHPSGIAQRVREHGIRTPLDCRLGDQPDGSISIIDSFSIEIHCADTFEVEVEAEAEANLAPEG
jgi:hypothetical protein